MNTPISEAARRAAEAAATFYSPNAWARKLDAADLAPIIQQALDSAQPVEGETERPDGSPLMRPPAGYPPIHAGNRPEDVGGLRPEHDHLTTPQDAVEIREALNALAPNPTLVQLAEGAAKELDALADAWDNHATPYSRADMSAVILRKISPEWERMVRENAALLAQNQKGSAEYLELRGNYRRTCDAMDALRTENERLTRERTQYLDSAMRANVIAKVQQDELESLRVRVRELEEDKNRIDSIEQAQRCIMCLHSETKNRGVWSVTFEDQHHTEYDTLREAMDALAADEARLDVQKRSAFDAARKGDTQS